jgi:fructose-1-phosphate kinase PfkB-like protein
MPAWPASPAAPACRWYWIPAAPPLLAALPQRPLLAKLNRRELADTFNRPRLRTAEVLRQARLLRTRGARMALVTDGPRGGWLVAEGAAWTARPPALAAVNPIGSGDSVTAGFLHAWLETGDPAQALRLGMACGAANALTRTPGEVDRAKVRELAAQVVVRAV